MRDANILILDYKEDLIRWLDPELAEVEETTQKDACRKIKITYPYENEHITENSQLWYQQGNKIYIPELNGIASCLYVINTQYEIDFWEKNTITVEAEEVLTELNYDMLSFKSGSVINITEEKLDEWFGAFYDISGLDKLSSNKKQVSPEGIMSRMSLLRMIEEETGRVFVTSYENYNNNIKRELFLADPNKLRFVAETETLDLNYNLESLEFIKSEEDTYNAMCPVFNNTSNVVTAGEITTNPDTKINTAVVNKAEQRTESNPAQINNYLATLNNKLLEAGITDSAPTIVSNNVDGDELLKKWLDYEVQEGQEIPMIIQQDEEGNTVVKAKWNAPFEKAEGELYIKYIGINQTDYNAIKPYNPAKAPTMMKCGKENTSETLVEAIYNELATSLLNKMNPEYELKIQVKDIQDMLGDYNLGYHVHESLQVRVPNFNYYVPCRITETVKNLHYPGENTIKIETEVVSIFDMIPTKIASEDRLIGTNEIDTVYGGILTTDEGEPLEDKYVTIDIRLTNAYQEGTTDTVEQEVKEFDPVKNTYYISDIQIQNLEKQLRNKRIKEGNARGYFKIRDVEGQVYSIEADYARSLVFTRNNIYIINEEVYGGGGDKALGKGFFDETVEAHIYPNARELIKNEDSFEKHKKYYFSLTYETYMTDSPFAFKSDPYPNEFRKYHGIYGSMERQNGPTCLPASMSNATALVFAYRTEYELAQLMQTSKMGTQRAKAEQVMADLGFKVERYEATEANIRKYFHTPNSFVSLSVDAEKLGTDYYKGVYARNDVNGSHAILSTFWADYQGTLYLQVLDTNLPVGHPAAASSNNLTLDDTWIPWSVIEKGINASYINGTWVNKVSPLKPWFTLFTITDKLLGDIDDSLTASLVNTTFNPELYDYKFDFSIIRKAIMELMDYVCSSVLDVDIMTCSSSIDTSTGVTLDNVSMWWLRAMAYAGMYYYHGKQEKTTNHKIIEANKASDSMKYYKHFDKTVDKISEYDWFTPCRVTDIAYTTGYICSTLLFNLGVPYSYFDFTGGNNYVNLDKLGDTITDKAGTVNGSKALHYWIVNIDDIEDIVMISQRSRDSFQDTVFLTWGYSDELNAKATIKDSKYPVMLINTWENGTPKITYQNILGTGNSPGNQYNTTAEGAGNSVPYGVTTLANIKTWNEKVKEQLNEGDKGKALVISWFKEEQFKEET